MDQNVNYSEMYYKMARAVEKAIRILVNAQLECEELYLNGCGEETPAYMPTYDDRMGEILANCNQSSDCSDLPENIF